MKIKNYISTVDELLLKTQQVSAPVDIMKCASALRIGIDVTTYQEKGILGVFIAKNGKRLIVINNKLVNDDSRHLQRFIVAHAIGHSIFHSQESSFFIEKSRFLICRDAAKLSQTEVVEKEANEFAMELLVPESFLKRELKRLTNEQRLNSVRYLSTLFSVDESVIFIKLTRLGLLEYGLSSSRYL